jgi:hypothetical protein
MKINLRSLLTSLVYVSILVAGAAGIALLLSTFSFGVWIVGGLALLYAVITGYQIVENRRIAKDYEKLEFERKIEKMKNKNK